MKSCLGSKAPRPLANLVDISSGGEVTSDIGKADLLNRFFAEQTTLPDENKHSPPHLVSSSRSFHTLRISSSEVYNVFKSLKKLQSAGNDDIPASLLLFCNRGISSSLASLFNRNFAEGSLPLERSKPWSFPFSSVAIKLITVLSLFFPL